MREDRTRAAADPAIGISNAFSSLEKRGSLDQLAAGPHAMSDQMQQRMSDLEPKRGLEPGAAGASIGEDCPDVLARALEREAPR